MPESRNPPFGMLTPGRSYSVGSSYRYGFNGKENDNEVKGEGNQQDYGFRIYDSRVGRFLSVDPLTQNYPWNSPYAFAENEPVSNKDLDGLERSRATDGSIYDGPVDMNQINYEVKRKLLNQQSSATTGTQLPRVNKPNTLFPSLGSGVGIPAVTASGVRLNYVTKAYALKSVYQNGTEEQKINASKYRNKLVVEARANTPEPYLSMAEDMKSSGNLEVKPNARFYKTNTEVNSKMAAVGAAGAILTGYGIYQSVTNIQNANNQIKQTAVEGSSWGGALFGGSQGATWGTAIAGPAGGFFGGIGGSIIGGVLGREGMEAMTSEACPNRGTIIITPQVQRGSSTPDNTRVAPTIKL